MTASERNSSEELGRTMPDAQRLSAQLAELSEGGGAGARPDSLRELLELIRKLLGARVVGLLSGQGAGESCVVSTNGVLAATLTQLATTLAPLRSTVQAAPGLGADGFTLAAPVLREGGQAALFVVQLTISNPRDIQAFVVLVQTLSGFFLYRQQRLATAELTRVLERLSGLLEIFRNAGAELEFEKACRLALDGLVEYFGCSRITLGLTRRGSCHVRAISGVAHVDSKNPKHGPMEAAMGEALMSATRIDALPDSAFSADTAAHELLLVEKCALRISTIPLPRNRGALLLEWGAETAPLPELPILLDASTPFVPMLFDLLERARPHAVVFAFRQFWAKAGRRRILVGSGCGLALLLAYPVPYQIGADCRLVPKVKRVIAAPYQGQLRRSVVQPGDSVTEGQVLAEMDNRDLRLKEAELSAAQGRALKQRDRAMSRGDGADIAEAQVSGFEAQSVGEDLAVVRRKLALLEVRSPIRGVVLSGDLRRAEGQPVQQGQILFEVAPLSEMIVEMEVRDRDIAHVRAGQAARFTVEAYGGGSWSSSVDRVHPQAETREGRNVFLCEAALRNVSGEALRPGMRGWARIESDRRPVAWILGHGLWDWIVTTLFW